MNRRKFWEIIEDTSSKQGAASDEQFFLIERILCKLPPKEVLTFENIKNELVIEASSFEMLIAAYIIYGELSDELYEDFRAFLILHGEEQYESAVAFPDSIAQWDFDNADSIEGESLHFVAEQAYVEQTDKDDFFKKRDTVTEPFFKDPMPESPKDFQKILPHLFDKFFNEENYSKNE
jgi:Protein of unknown function (DUF4240)